MVTDVVDDGRSETRTRCGSEQDTVGEAAVWRRACVADEDEHGKASTSGVGKKRGRAKEKVAAAQKQTRVVGLGSQFL
jgi:hypothetical protein